MGGYTTINPTPSGDITGSGTANYIAMFSSPNVIGDSVVYQAAGKLYVSAANTFAVNTATPSLSVGYDSQSIIIAGVTYASVFASYISSGTSINSQFVSASAVASASSVSIGARSRGSFSSSTAVQSGDSIHSFYSVGHDGTDYAIATAIEHEVDNTVGANQVPGRIKFSTANAAGTITERLRIDSSGNSIFSSTITGGTAVGSSLTYKSTTAAGTTTAAAHTFTGGTNGGTTIAAYFNNGRYVGYSNITSGSGLVVGNEYKGYFYSGAATQHGVSFISAYTVTGETTITQSNGLLTAIYHDKGFTLPEWQGIETGAAFVDGAGSVITNAWGLAAHLPTCSAGGTVTNAAGIFIKSMASTGITNPFAIYSESVYNSVFAGAVTLGSTTPLTSSLVNLRVNKGTSFIEVGEVSSGIGAIWGNQSSLLSTNYALGFNGSTITELQSSNDIRFKIAGTINYRIQGTTQIFSPSAATSGAITPFTFTIAASTGQTASTEIPNFKVTGNTKTWAAGAITTQRWNYLTANTAAFASASTITNSYGLYVEAATAGTNATITNNYAAGFSGGIKIITNAVDTTATPQRSFTMTGLTGGDGILCDAQSGNACAWRFARGGTEMIYLGMDSGANNNIALINRLSGTLYFSTNNTARLTIGAAGGFTIGDANDFTFNTTTGSKFGTATTQKLSFWNATPIVQPANTVAIDTLLVNTGLRATGAYANFDTTISPRAGTATANTAPLKFTSGTNLTAAEAGALEYNNDFFITDSSGARKSILGKLYNQTTSVTVANSVVETSLLTSTTTLPANFFSASKQIVLRLRGYHSAVSNPTIRIKVKLGSVVVLDTTAIVSGNSTNEYFDIDGVICCRTTGATGTVMGQGFYLECGGGGNHFGMVNTSAVTIDTTTTQVFDITVQWGTASASNTITATNGYIFVP